MNALADALTDLFGRLGVKSGEVLLVHSGTGSLGNLIGDGGVSPSEAVKALHEALTRILGPEGTIVAPSFFYDYARKGRPFVLEHSRPDTSLGFYPLHMFGLEGCKRSLNPIGSLQAMGRQAETICAHTSAYGFGLASPWARLVDLDARCLIIGTPFIMTFIHHVEALVGTPQIYNKIHRIPVIVAGKEIDLPVITAIRYLKYGISYTMETVERDLIERGVIKTVNENGVNAQLVSLRDVQDMIFEKLLADPFYMLERSPEFMPGEPPDDGAQRDKE